MEPTAKTAIAPRGKTETVQAIATATEIVTAEKGTTIEAIEEMTGATATGTVDQGTTKQMTIQDVKMTAVGTSGATMTTVEEVVKIQEDVDAEEEEMRARLKEGPQRQKDAYLCLNANARRQAGTSMHLAMSSTQQCKLSKQARQNYFKCYVNA